MFLVHFTTDATFKHSKITSAYCAQIPHRLFTSLFRPFKIHMIRLCKTWLEYMPKLHVPMGLPMLAANHCTAKPGRKARQNHWSSSNPGSLPKECFFEIELILKPERVHMQTQRHKDTQTHRHTDTQRHTDTHRHTQTHTDTQRHTETHRDTQRHTETHRDTQRHTETHRDTQRHTETHRDTQRHTETHRDTQRHTDTQTHRHTDTQTHRHTETQTHTHTHTLTLAQKYLIELLMWNASHVHKQLSKTDRHVWKI